MRRETVSLGWSGFAESSAKTADSSTFTNNETGENKPWLGPKPETKAVAPPDANDRNFKGKAQRMVLHEAGRGVYRNSPLTAAYTGGVKHVFRSTVQSLAARQRPSPGCVEPPWLGPCLDVPPMARDQLNGYKPIADNVFSTASSS